MSPCGGARCAVAPIPSAHETAAAPRRPRPRGRYPEESNRRRRPVIATMTTNVTDEHRRAFEALTSGRYENFALVSCFCAGVLIGVEY